MKVLIVDDEVEIVSLLKEFVLEIFDEVEVAYDGIEAMEAFRSQKFDLIISDLNMKNSDGIEFLSEVRKLDLHIPFYILTSFVGIEDESILENLNVTEVFTKPRFDPLLEAIKKHHPENQTALA
ncbi:MAG: CheY-like chemotaxis protein [Bacteriovoracaceae bacterium]|jgi:CheY-like chemotaxis protein